MSMEKLDRGLIYPIIDHSDAADTFGEKMLHSY